MMNVLLMDGCKTLLTNHMIEARGLGVKSVEASVDGHFVARSTTSRHATIATIFRRARCAWKNRRKPKDQASRVRPRLSYDWLRGGHRPGRPAHRSPGDAGRAVLR